MKKKSKCYSPHSTRMEVSAISLEIVRSYFQEILYFIEVLVETIYQHQFQKKEKRLPRVSPFQPKTSSAALRAAAARGVHRAPAPGAHRGEGKVTKIMQLMNFIYFAVPTVPSRCEASSSAFAVWYALATAVRLTALTPSAAARRCWRTFSVP